MWSRLNSSGLPRTHKARYDNSGGDAGSGCGSVRRVFSYSLYLTHELVIMQSWWFITRRLPPVLNTLLIVVPATVALAWVFYRFCEKPYMRKAPKRVERLEEQSDPEELRARICTKTAGRR